jgi:hypothetical protein
MSPNCQLEITLPAPGSPAVNDEVFKLLGAGSEADAVGGSPGLESAVRCRLSETCTAERPTVTISHQSTSKVELTLP